MLNSRSVWWQLIGVAVIVGALTLAPAEHQSASFVFTHFHNDTGFSSPFYVAHVAEETTDARVSAPRGPGDYAATQNSPAPELPATPLKPRGRTR